MTLKLHNLKTGMCHFGPFSLPPPWYPFDRNRCPDSQMPILFPLEKPVWLSGRTTNEFTGAWLTHKIALISLKLCL